MKQVQPDLFTVSDVSLKKNKAQICILHSIQNQFKIAI